jgi:hypothetical protein
MTERSIYCKLPKRAGGSESPVKNNSEWHSGAFYFEVDLNILDQSGWNRGNLPPVPVCRDAEAFCVATGSMGLAHVPTHHE